MGSTNKTTNYELSQFVGTDKPSWLGDYNADMGKIDLAIKARAVEAGQAQSSADTANGKADALDTRMGTAEDNILALQNASTTDHTQIATNTANISKNAQDIVQLDAKIGHTQITIGDHTVTGAIATLAQGSGDADNISYNNTTSGLTATNVQDAIDEVKADIPDDASEVAYSNTQSGLSATTVQGAIDELAGATPQTSETVRYVESTDMIQLYKNGVWTDWVTSGVANLSNILTTPLASNTTAECVVSDSNGSSTAYTALNDTAWNIQSASFLKCTLNSRTFVKQLRVDMSLIYSNVTHFYVTYDGNNWEDIGPALTGASAVTDYKTNTYTLNSPIMGFGLHFTGTGGNMNLKNLQALV